MDTENKLKRNEKRLSESGEKAVNDLFDIFNRELFGGELPRPRFLLYLARSYTSAEFLKATNTIRLMVCVREWSDYANPYTGQESFEKDCKAELPESLVHEMCHLWQAPLKIFPEFPLREFIRLKNEGNFDEIHRREDLQKAYWIMHDKQFADKMLSLGIAESYSGKNMRYTKVEQILPGGLFQKSLENNREQIGRNLDVLIPEMFSYIKPRAVRELC